MFLNNTGGPVVSTGAIRYLIPHVAACSAFLSASLNDNSGGTG